MVDHQHRGSLLGHPSRPPQLGPHAGQEHQPSRRLVEAEPGKQTDLVLVTAIGITEAPTQSPFLHQGVEHPQGEQQGRRHERQPRAPHGEADAEDAEVEAQVDRVPDPSVGSPGGEARRRQGAHRQPPPAPPQLGDPPPQQARPAGGQQQAAPPGRHLPARQPVHPPPREPQPRRQQPPEHDRVAQHDGDATRDSPVRRCHGSHPSCRVSQIAIAMPGHSRDRIRGPSADSGRDTRSGRTPRGNDRRLPWTTGYNPAP